MSSRRCLLSCLVLAAALLCARPAQAFNPIPTVS